MNFLIILTQAVLLFYGSPIFESAARLDRFRFVCYALITGYGILLAGTFKLRRLRWFDFIIGSVLIFSFLSHFYSLDPDLTLKRVGGNTLLYFAVFWAFWISCRSPEAALRHLRSFLTIWTLFYIVNVAFMFIHPQESFGLFHGDIVPGGYKRFIGITANPNGIGNFSAIILPLAIWNCRQRRTALNLFFVAAIVFSFFFSFSRNAFICSVLGTSIYLYMSTRRRRGLLILGAIFLVVLMVVYTDLTGRFLLPRALVRPESLDMLGGRTEAWKTALELIQKRPWSGYGFGVEELVFNTFSIRFMYHSGLYVHNSFLGLALQLGWAAAYFVYLALTLFFIRGFLFLLRLRSPNESLRMLTIALFASTVSAFWTSFFESWLYASGGIIAFTFYSCIVLLMRMIDFQKIPYHPSDVRDRGRIPA